MRATYETWQRKNGVASWTFSIPVLPNEDATQALPRCVGTILVALTGFARLHEVDLVTAEHGEESRSIPGGAVEASGLESVFDGSDHIVSVSLSLDLLVITRPEENERVIEQAGVIDLEIDDHTSDEGTIGMHISIDIDIYSPITWGKHRDNRALAELNGPRLSRFLAAVRSKLRGTCDAIDAENYPDLVDETGFRLR
jgi:hypothetical protein